MGGLMKSTGAAGFGLLTSVMTAGLNLAVLEYLDFNIFTLMVWFVVPMGAILCGMAASSGYYYGATLLHARPSVVLFIQMLMVAAFTQGLIYYLEYITWVLPDRTVVSDVITFAEYLDLSLTSATYSMGSSGSPGAELGQLGYWVAGLQLVGFMGGGALIFIFLKGRLMCEACDKYYWSVGSVTKQFDNQESFAKFYDSIYEAIPNATSFSMLLGLQSSSGKTKQGSINHEISLLRCPECGNQVVVESVKVHNGSDWAEVPELKRQTLAPNSVDLVPAITGG